MEDITVDTGAVEPVAEETPPPEGAMVVHCRLHGEVSSFVAFAFAQACSAGLGGGFARVASTQTSLLNPSGLQVCTSVVVGVQHRFLCTQQESVRSCVCR